MTRLHLFSEPFAPTGNLAGTGVQKLLGRPSLGPLQTLVREGLQNSLDAVSGDAGVHVSIRIRTLTDDQRLVLAKDILPESPVAGRDTPDLRSSLTHPGLMVLELCDTGTEGLSGPTRADAGSGDEPSNFVNFLRNVGAARDVNQGGGTYGYGKSALYRMSRCSTIVIDTMTRHDGQPVRRLMACHLGEAFEAEDKGGRSTKYTGRHWWGKNETGTVEPATEEEAAELARNVGMPPRSTKDTGTSILVVDPDLDGATPHECCENIIEAILWNFWPRMAASTPKTRRLKITVQHEDKILDVPAPESFPPLNLFTKALDARRAGSDDFQDIRCGRPAKHLGKLSIARGFREERTGSLTSEGSLIPAHAHHVALMRPVELVVKYLPGTPLADSRFEWGGVFICSDDDEVERAFADSEPPAHDDWVVDNLQGHAKTFVRVAYKRILEAVAPRTPPSGASNDPSPRPSLASTAARLGTLLGNTSARGPGKPSHRPRKASQRKQEGISRLRFQRLEPGLNDGIIAVFSALLRNKRKVPLELEATPHLVADGGAVNTDDMPSNSIPAIKSIHLLGTDLETDQSRLDVGIHEGEIEIRVASGPDVAVGIKVSLYQQVTQ